MIDRTDRPDLTDMTNLTDLTERSNTTDLTIIQPIVYTRVDENHLSKYCSTKSSIILYLDPSSRKIKKNINVQ